MILAVIEGLPIISFDAGLKSAQAIIKCRFCRFQEPGRAERDVERTGTRASLEKMLSSGARQLMVAPEDGELLEAIHAGEPASMDNRLRRPMCSSFLAPRISLAITSESLFQNLKDVVFLEDGGRFIQQEQATKVNELQRACCFLLQVVHI